MNSHSAKKMLSMTEGPYESLDYSEVMQSLTNSICVPVDLESLRADYRDLGPGRRACARYSLQITVLICNQQKAFRTRSENVSFSGLLMRDHLPEVFHQGSFDVILIDESQPGAKQYMLFKGQAVAGGIPRRRVVFHSVCPEAKEKLHALISDLTPLSVA